jgi:hypothetical protein
MSSHGAAANATSAGRNERLRARRHAPKADEPGEAEEDGQEEMRVTTAGENRLMVYGSKSVLFAALLLSGCTQEETTANSRGDLQVRTSRQFLLPPWSLRQKIALTCRILAAEGHESALAGQITARFTQRNVEMLRKRGLPVTPGTLYLAHFAGGAGAVAILSAMENADAARVMATADATGRTNRENIINAKSLPPNASPSLILGTGRTAKCAFLVHSC